MSRTAAELAQYLDATLAGDSQARISGVASPEKAGPENLLYVESRKQVTRAEASAARCVILSEGLTVAG